MARWFTTTIGSMRRIATTWISRSGTTRRRRNIIRGGIIRAAIMADNRESGARIEKGK
jgi:hypothetical protein